MEKGKVLAIDYGRKMVGLASGDLEIGIAFPRDVLENKGMSDLAEKIFGLCGELEVVMIVLGLPQQESDIKDEIVSFGRLLEAKGVIVEFVDEDFSSVEAQQMMAGHEVKRFDANAAQIILQRFFNK